MNTHVYDFQIRALLTKEDGEFVAHALEMDLVGYGPTEKEALTSLSGMIEAQISFAAQQGDDSLIHFPAPQEFVTRWETAHAAALKREIFPDKSVKLSTKAVVVTFTRQDVLKAIRSRRFSPVDSALA